MLRRSFAAALRLSANGGNPLRLVAMLTAMHRASLFGAFVTVSLSWKKSGN